MAKVLPPPYRMPLYYELILSAQGQLKRRNYHVAVIEVETAFEVYIADLLLRLRVGIGESREQILKDMEDPKRIGLLAQRLRSLDAAAVQCSKLKGLAPWTPFVGSAVHREWPGALYDVRNRVVHDGDRGVPFDVAKRGIVAGKSAIKHLEACLPDFPLCQDRCRHPTARI